MDIKAKTGMDGVYSLEHRRNGKILYKEDINNLVVNQGLTHILDILFKSGTQITAWYLGIFEANYTPAADDTAANIAARSTESTAYDEATRQTFTAGAISSNAVDNTASRATFTINATKTMYGVFLASTSAKSGTLGTLLSVASFTTARPVIAGDELLVTYTMTAQDV